MPRPASIKTTVGKARKEIGITAKMLSDRSGVGTSTIQKIEADRFPLSEEIAYKLGLAMCVDPVWLLDGKAKSPVQLIGGFSLEGNEKALSAARQRLSSTTHWTEEDRQEMAKHANTILEGMGALFTRALNDGKFMQIALDAEMFFRRTVKNYYPKDYPKYWGEHRAGIDRPNETAPAVKNPTSKRKK